MAGKTSIEWTRGDDGTAGSTWNPLRGCTRVSPGCGGPGPHGGCYAEQIAARFSDPGMPFHGIAERTKAGGRWTGNVVLVDLSYHGAIPRFETRDRKGGDMSEWPAELRVREMPR